MSALFLSLFFMTAGLLGGLAHAASLTDAAAVPYLNAAGEDGYRQFLATPSPRAFAIAPGGAWGYSTEAAASALAEQEALANCQANTRQRCQVYAVDHAVTLNPATWARAWQPYKSAAQAARAATGTGLGERFPNLRFADPQGKPIKLSDLRGKVVVLHFWGSWCPPCQREMPDLARLVAASKANRDLRFVLLQVREDFASARAWATRTASKLPLHDSGMTGGKDAFLKLADGGKIADRELARAFPTTYILDKHGLVLFAHTGPVSDWLDYRPLLLDALAHSGN